MEDEQAYRYLTRRIGSTTYKVKIAFSDSEAEPMEDKILRMICAEAMEIGEKGDIMSIPPMSRQSERSAS